MMSLALFTMSSLMCVIAPTLGVLLSCRVVQGAGGGALVTSEQAMLASAFPGPYFGVAFAVYALAVILAPAIGPVLGGWITDNYSWRWAFFINVPVGVLSLLLTRRLIDYPTCAAKPENGPRPRAVRAQRIGVALTAIVFVYRLAVMIRPSLHY